MRTAGDEDRGREGTGDGIAESTIKGSVQQARSAAGSSPHLDKERDKRRSP